MTHGGALYCGALSHTRYLPQRHAFAYRLFMLCLDRDALPQLFDAIPLWSARDLVQQRCGRRPAGPVRVFAHLRYFGYQISYQINPVRLHFLAPPAAPLWRR